MGLRFFARGSKPAWVRSPWSGNLLLTSLSKGLLATSIPHLVRTEGPACDPILKNADTYFRRANHRTDAYGGLVQNRCRFILELVDTVNEIFGGPGFVCVKLCPTDILNDSVITFEEMQETYTYLIKALVKRKVGIINICRRGSTHDIPGYDDLLSKLKRPDGYPLPPNYDPVLDFGRLVKYPGSRTLLMANHDYGVEDGNRLIEEDQADLLQLGRPFIYNPVSCPSLSIQPIM
jgi:2,4-dienoyl-CoA reductase-like NADH-dependent reductase (Old Yellow Enzyme family)